MKYGRPDCTAKAGNIPGRTNIYDRPEETDGRRSGDWEMDTTTGRNGKGAILTLTETIGQLHSHRKSPDTTGRPHMR